MFKLIKLNNDHFMLNSEGFTVKSVDGPKREIIRYMLRAGFEEEEIFLGMNALVNDNNDIAEYGMFKKFIFGTTFKKVA